jgi:hypothetical protein
VSLPFRIGQSILSLLSDRMLAGGARALFVRSWRQFSDAIDRPREIQVARLLALVSRARDTAFGRAHGFADIRTLEDYRRSVPIRGYEGFEPYIARMLQGEEQVLIPDRPYFFARTSGTTGTPKHIPVTEMYVAEYRRPRRVWARQVMQAFPGLVRGQILTIHSPRIEGTTPGGAPFGSVTIGLSGERKMAAFATGHPPMEPSPRSVFLLEDFDLKYYVILRLAAQADISLAAAVNPSTLVLLAKKLDEHADRLERDLRSGSLSEIDRLPPPTRREVERLLRTDARAADRIEGSRRTYGRALPTELWPKIAGLLSWKGGSAPFYRAQLEAAFPGRSIMDYGYIATEGGFSIPLSPEGAAGVTAVSGHVLEFIREDAFDPGAPALLADELEVGRRYRVVITGSHGLYRYDINDVVECVGHLGRTAEIQFVHKGGNMLSITGEKVGERHVAEASARAEAECGVVLVGLSVAIDPKDPPRYLFAAELDREREIGDLRRLLASLEAALRAANIEYEAKRASRRLGAPALILLEAGAFERFRRERVAAGAPDSHVKPPHVVKDERLFGRLGIRATIEGEA